MLFWQKPVSAKQLFVFWIIEAIHAEIIGSAIYGYKLGDNKVFWSFKSNILTLDWINWAIFQIFGMKDIT